MVVLGMMVVFASICFNFNILLPDPGQADTGRRPADVRDRLHGLFRRRRLARRASGTAARTRLRWRVMFIGAAGFGLSELVIAPLTSIYAVGVLLFVCGLFFTTYTASSNTAIQLASPDYIRGRVLGLYYYAWNGLAPIGSVLVGWLCGDRGCAPSSHSAIAGASAIAVTARGRHVAVRRPKPAKAPAVCRVEPAAQLAA